MGREIAPKLHHTGGESCGMVICRLSRLVVHVVSVSFGGLAVRGLHPTGLLSAVGIGVTGHNFIVLASRLSGVGGDRVADGLVGDMHVAGMTGGGDGIFPFDILAGL